MATTQQFEMLRAMVEADFERQEAISHELAASGGLNGYGAVIGAAFYLAVRRQFPQGYTADDVIKLVADTRTLIDHTGDAIDPRSAELVVRSALGEGGLVSEIPDATVVQVQIAVCSALAAEHKLGDPDTFMAEVRQLLAEWGG